MDWWPWSHEALAEAERLERPLFISIGYAACHWCHVMAHESFEDPQIAQFLNAHFIPIKIDREERPDLDAFYMTATQAVTGHGGWPMSVFATPDGRPFYAGTYFPPIPRHGMPSFPQLLEAIASAWRDRRDEVLAQAQELEGAVAHELGVVDRLTPVVQPVSARSLLERCADELLASVDGYGGFGGAPKFPRADYVETLALVNPTAPLLERTLSAMSREGLFDHLEGGFARYSVDATWHVPHFEKMLYDQALLSRAYLVASATQKSPTWREVALATLEFCEEHLRLPSGGYASSLDADAAGHEGSHITWTDLEVESALEGFDRHTQERILDRYRLREMDFEGRAIPRLAHDEPFSPPRELVDAINALRTVRRGRPQPGRDDKVVLEWNAMLLSSLVAARTPTHTQRAITLFDDLQRLTCREGRWHRTDSGAPATASDVAWLALAALDLFELNGQGDYLACATSALDQLLTDHYDGRGLFTSSRDTTDVPGRIKEVFDGATPSVYGMAVRALWRAARHTGGEHFANAATTLVSAVWPLAEEHPRAVIGTVLAEDFLELSREIVVCENTELADFLHLTFVPHTMTVSSPSPSQLLADKSPGWGYLCHLGRCEAPVQSVTQLRQQLSEVDGAR